jgi:hypothetical protein
MDFPPGFNQPNDEEIRVEAKESIKLIKNSKGWNWEIKLIDKDNIESQLDRLDRINARMKEKYPNG